MCTLEEQFVKKGEKKGRREGEKKGRQEGEKIGELKTLVRVALSMLSSGDSFEYVQKHTGLTLKKLKELAASLKQTVESHPTGAPA